MQNLAFEYKYEKYQNTLEYIEYIGKIQITMWIVCECGQYFDNPRNAHHNKQFYIHGESVCMCVWNRNRMMSVSVNANANKFTRMKWIFATKIYVTKIKWIYTNMALFAKKLLRRVCISFSVSICIRWISALIRLQWIDVKTNSTEFRNICKPDGSKKNRKCPRQCCAVQWKMMKKNYD